MNFTVTQIWIPEVYPGLEAGGRLVGVILACRKRNYLELNNSKLLELLAHINNKKELLKSVLLFF